MQEQIEYKRITKYGFIQTTILETIVAVLLGIMAHSVLLSICLVLYSIFGQLFLFSIDKKIKLSFSIPSFLVLQAANAVVVYFVFSHDLNLLGLSFLLPGFMFLSSFTVFLRIKEPSFVHQGTFIGEDAKVYQMKLLKKLLIIAIVALAFAMILLGLEAIIFHIFLQ